MRPFVAHVAFLIATTILSAALSVYPMQPAEPLARLYLAHAGELSTFQRGRLRCRETVRELVQECFVRLIACAAEAPIGNARALLFRIAGNLAIDHHRVHGKTEFTPLDELDPLTCPRPGPEQIVMARQEFERVARAIETLPRKCRTIFVEHKIEGIAQRDIASQRDISLNAVEKHLIRAMLHLRNWLG